jgi:hypothetical protein
MCMSERALRLLLGSVLLLVAAGASAATDSPALGEPLDPATIADLTVLPDGTGLPPGSGTAAAGEALFQQHCAACHGADGGGTLNDRLVGGIGSLAGAAPVKTVGSYWPYATTLFDYLRRAMPYQSPGSLSADELYAVTAYVLFLNGIVAREARLDAGTLPAVAMPNRDGFSRAWPVGTGGDR